MSTRELRRAGVLARVAAQTLTLKAAELMDASYRQAKRLYGRYARQGLKHRHAGRVSNRALGRPQRTRELVTQPARPPPKRQIELSPRRR